MIHDRNLSPANNRAAAAYRGDVAERVRRFLPMVRKLAWHLNGAGRPGIELEDMIQAGLVALTECAQGHSGPGEDGFAAYAKLRVRGAMIDLIRRTSPGSRAVHQRRRRLETAERNLRLTLGRAPGEGELAEALGVDAAGLAALRLAAEAPQIQSLDEVYSDSDGAFADERPDTFTLLADDGLREAVAAAVAQLPERLQMVMQLHYVEELNLTEIAQVLNVSVPRIHQLKARATELLRAALADTAELL